MEYNKLHNKVLTNLPNIICKSAYHVSNTIGYAHIPDHSRHTACTHVSTHTYHYIDYSYCNYCIFPGPSIFQKQKDIVQYKWHVL